METARMDIDRALVLDANAAAGLLAEVFGVEMTAELTECAHCGNEAAVGALHAFTQAPGVILRCPACSNVVLRIVRTDEGIHLDARGAVYLRLRKSSD